MSIAHSEEERLFEESLRRFLQTENEFEQRRRRLSKPNPNRMALWPGIADIGAIGAAFDEDDGGFAGGMRTVAIAMMEFGRALAVEPFLSCAVVAGHILAAQSERSVARPLLARIIAGQMVVVLAHDAGVDPFGKPQTVAQRIGEVYVLNGFIRCVRHADVADEFLVPAQLGDEVAIFGIPRAALSLLPYRLMDGSGASDLRLQGLSVQLRSRMMFARPEMLVLAGALERGLLGLAAETAGIVIAANTATFRYLGERKQFGVPLGSFQALQHRAANMEIAAQELLSMLGLAIESFADAVANRSALLAALKALADTTGRLVGHEAIQLHGGMGVSDELNISHYAQRLATIRAELGSSDIHKQRFGTEVAVSDLLALQDTAETREWREFVRQFTRAHLPERIALKGRL